jgi:hypothetical protein
MKIHTYLSLIPEALVLSHLPPDQFGKYMAIGNRRKIEGPVVFFELDPGADYSAFKMEEARKRCVPHADGSPHRSIYVAVYNVIPRIPLDALVKAYLTTPSGFTLGHRSRRMVAEPGGQVFPLSGARSGVSAGGESPESAGILPARHRSRGDGVSAAHRIHRPVTRADGGGSGPRRRVRSKCHISISSICRSACTRWHRDRNGRRRS